MMTRIAGKSQDRGRRRFYIGLLLFIILAGVPTIAIPKLRNRLYDRFHVLRTAWVGEETLSMNHVGGNMNPYPREYERPKTQEGNSAQLQAIASALSVHKEPVANSSSLKVIGILEKSKNKGQASSSAKEKTQPEIEDASSADSPNFVPQYKQDGNEKAAYELVLKSNKTLSEMVRGSNPDLHWKTWGAALRKEGVYLVRVIFLNREKQEVEYIWEVKLASGEVSPLSFNARSIS
jgi:hypothetical protein